MSYEEINKKHSELWFALESLLDCTKIEGSDDWETVEKKNSETLKALDALFAVDFEIPSTALPQPRPSPFGAAFGEFANTSSPIGPKKTSIPVKRSKRSGSESKKIKASTEDSKKISSKRTGPDNSGKKDKSSRTKNSEEGDHKDENLTSRKLKTHSPSKRLPLQNESSKYLNTSRDNSREASPVPTRQKSEATGISSPSSLQLSSTIGDLTNSKLSLSIAESIDDSSGVDILSESSSYHYKNDDKPDPSILPSVYISEHHEERDYIDDMDDDNVHMNVVEPVEEEVPPLDALFWNKETDTSYSSGLDTPRLDSPESSDDEKNNVEEIAHSPLGVQPVSRLLAERALSSLSEDSLTTPRGTSDDGLS